MNRRSTLTLAAVAAASIASVSYAAIPDSGTGIIHSCYSQSLGTWRPIDTQAGQKCKIGETSLDFNQKGPAGAQGPAGPTGPTGPTGPAGKDGTSVTSSSLAAGNANCPSGGSSFTSVSGTTYACNGAPGKDGTDGKDGVNGTSVTSTPLAAGDSSCPNGGSKFTSASGDTYACNGSPGGSPSVTTVTGDLVSLPAGDFEFVTVSCPSGASAISGGYAVTGLSTPYLHESDPSGNSWDFGFGNAGSTGTSVIPVVVCLS